MENLKLVLVDTKAEMAAAWGIEFRELPVVAQVGDLFAMAADAVVSPANSFGFMDGGLDGKLRDFFGMEIETTVRERIRRDYDGELLVGQAFVTPTGRPQYPYLITAPTMRVPSEVSRSINAYLAMCAILRTALRHPEIHSVICSGLCSLSGRMAAPIVARQMRAAYERVLLSRHRFSHWNHERDFEAYLRGELSYMPEPGW